MSRDQIIGSWQCQRCHLAAMTMWRGSPNPDDAPACCSGELMLPYRIPSREALDTKIVSRWIHDIELATAQQQASDQHHD